MALTLVNKTDDRHVHPLARDRAGKLQRRRRGLERRHPADDQAHTGRRHAGRLVHPARARARSSTTRTRTARISSAPGCTARCWSCPTARRSTPTWRRWCCSADPVPPPPTSARAPLEINRSTNPLPMTLKVGTKYRFRLIDISPNDIGDCVAAGRGRAGPVEGGRQGRRGAAAGSGHREPPVSRSPSVRRTTSVPACRAGGTEIGSVEAGG